MNIFLLVEFSLVINGAGDTVLGLVGSHWVGGLGLAFARPTPEHVKVQSKSGIFRRSIPSFSRGQHWELACRPTISFHPELEVKILFSRPQPSPLPPCTPP